MASKHSKHGFVSGLCRIAGRLALGASFVALPAAAARAEPTTYWEAQAKADQYQKKAEQYRAFGGAAYKSGLVRQANAEAAKYSTLADKLAAPPDEPTLSPEAERDARLAANYRFMGGKAAYSTGLVQGAEAAQEKAEGRAEGTVKVTDEAGGKVTERDNYACQPNKPIAMIDCNKTEEAK